MKTERRSSFQFLILGMVVFSTVCFYSFSFPLAQAATPVPTTITSKEAREVRVFLKAQRFGFYEKGNLVFWGPVCSGAKRCLTPRGWKRCDTPKGEFRILFKKAKGYVSEEYKAPMPYAIKFSPQGHFLHVGDVRSTPSSHGCVRLCEEDAKRIFLLVKIKDPVIVTD